MAQLGRRQPFRPHYGLPPVLTGPPVTVALTGQSLAVAGGTLVPALALALTGQAASVAQGTLTPANSLALSGQSVAVAQGSVTAALALSLSGQEATLAQQSITTARSLALSGQSLAAAQGSVTAGMSGLTLSGLSLTVARGSLVPGTSPPLVGQSLTAGRGSLSPAIDAALLGQGVIVSKGTLFAPSASPPVKIAISGGGRDATVSTGGRELVVSGGGRELSVSGGGRRLTIAVGGRTGGTGLSSGGGSNRVSDCSSDCDAAIVANGVTDMSVILTASLATLAAAGGGIRQLPAGTIKCNSAVTWPTANNVALVGKGIGATTLDFSASTTGGLVYAAPTRISYSALWQLSIHGGGAGSGIGIDFADTDVLTLEECRIYNWDTCVKISSTATRGALRNRIIGCILTNGTTNGLWLTGAQGPHETLLIGGQLSICGTGLRIDSPTDDCRVFGTQLESNTQAINTNGCRGEFDCRFEGNTADMLFGASAYYNTLCTGFFDPAKHSDVATGAGIGTNRVVPKGFFTSVTERLAPYYIPGDPMSLALTSQVPGNLMSVSHIFHIDNMRKVTTVSIVPTVQSGNVDIAICNAGGTVLASTGSTAVGAINTKQDINLTAPVYLGPDRDYYITTMFDNGTAGLAGVTSTANGFALMQSEIGGRQQTLTFPIAAQNPLSGASGTTIVPAVRLG